jgi:hypothetical protein
MKLLSMSRLAIIALLCVAVTRAVSIAPRNLNNFEGHRSSFKATLMMADGTVREVTLEGVGCPQGICSRVKAREQVNSIWLDGLASVREISQTAGDVTAKFKFKDGTQRHASIIAINRVLYVHRPFGFTEKIDLGSVSSIDFE